MDKNNNNEPLAILGVVVFSLVIILYTIGRIVGSWLGL